MRQKFEENNKKVDANITVLAKHIKEIKRVSDSLQTIVIELTDDKITEKITQIVEDLLEKSSKKSQSNSDANTEGQLKELKQRIKDLEFQSITGLKTQDESIDNEKFWKVDEALSTLKQGITLLSIS